MVSGPSSSRPNHALVWRQHVAFRTDSGQAQGVSHDHPKVSVPGWASMNPSNINYNTLKAAEALKRL